MSAASNVSCTSVNFFSWAGSMPAPGVMVYCFKEEGSIACTDEGDDPINNALPRSSPQIIFRVATNESTMPSWKLPVLRICSDIPLLFILLRSRRILVTGWQIRACVTHDEARRSTICQVIIAEKKTIQCIFGKISCNYLQYLQSLLSCVCKQCKPKYRHLRLSYGTVYSLHSTVRRFNNVIRRRSSSWQLERFFLFFVPLLEYFFFRIQLNSNTVGLQR